MEIAILLYLISSLLLLPYGYNCLVLVYGAYKYKQPKPLNLKKYPYVTVQIPVYNEKYIMRKLLNAVTKLRWPRDRLEILILDDSTDETTQIIDQEVKKHGEKRHKIKVIRRGKRTGYKAGALNQALQHTNGEFIAILDADFVPEPDFLLKTVPHLQNNPEVGFVQTRWGHLNRHQNRFTEAFSISLDAHHLVDQAGRYSLGLLTCFNGSAGVLRASAIRAVGGWSSETLSEDMDLSFKMQLAGWKGIYLRDVVTYGLVPSNMAAFRVQQSRWAKGSIQCARKHLGNVWRSPLLSFSQKLQASIQLTNYGISLLMLMLVFMEVLMMSLDYLIQPSSIPLSYFGRIILDPRLSILFTFCSLCTFSYYYTALKVQGIGMWSKAGYVGFLALIGHGISAICGIGILEGLFAYGGVFERVPKFNVGSKLKQFKVDQHIKFQGVENTLAVYSGMGLFCAYLLHLLPIASYLFVYIAGFYVVSSSLK